MGPMPDTRSRESVGARKAAMSRSGPRSARTRIAGFHELPLVLFTTLGIAGGGIGTSSLVEAAIAGASPVLSPSQGMMLCVLLGAGFLLSAGHLGKPLRGPLALRGVGRSALSNEILALGIALGGGLLGVTLPSAHPLQSVAGLLAGFGSLAFLLTLGVVYRLPGQLTWRGPALVHPLVLGTAWGLLMGFGGEGISDAVSTPGPGSRLPVFWLALLADALLLAYRWRVVEMARGEGEPRHFPAFRFRRGLLGVRAAFVSVLTPLAFLGRGWGAALLALSLGLFMDRLLFYALAVRRTTESEVARVEALL